MPFCFWCAGLKSLVSFSCSEWNANEEPCRPGARPNGFSRIFVFLDSWYQPKQKQELRARLVLPRRSRSRRRRRGAILSVVCNSRISVAKPEKRSKTSSFVWGWATTDEDDFPAHTHSASHPASHPVSRNARMRPRNKSCRAPFSAIKWNRDEQFTINIHHQIVWFIHYTSLHFSSQAKLNWFAGCN